SAESLSDDGSKFVLGQTFVGRFVFEGDLERDGLRRVLSVGEARDGEGKQDPGELPMADAPHGVRVSRLRESSARRQRMMRRIRWRSRWGWGTLAYELLSQRCPCCHEKRVAGAHSPQGRRSCRRLLVHVFLLDLPTGVRAELARST